MGFFDELAEGFNDLMGGADSTLLATGRLGRGEITGIQLSNTTMSVMNGLEERICTFTLRVMLDGEQPYEATTTQRVPEINIPALQQPGVVLAVRVDPNDRTKVAIDFNSQAPQVQVAEATGPGSAAHVLATGAPVTVVVVGSQPLGITNHAGDPVHALTLTVADGVPTPYQVQVGNAVPATALPLLYPGSKLHAKLGDQPGAIVVDWAAGAVDRG